MRHIPPGSPAPIFQCRGIATQRPIINAVMRVPPNPEHTASKLVLPVPVKEKGENVTTSLPVPLTTPRSTHFRNRFCMVPDSLLLTRSMSCDSDDYNQIEATATAKTLCSKSDPTSVSSSNFLSCKQNTMQRCKPATLTKQRSEGNPVC
jgi:hypothetical protein